jgi:hypothetical protein
MRWTIKLALDAVPRSPVQHEIEMIERAEEISPAIEGLATADGNASLAIRQEKTVTAHVHQHVANIKPCPRCGKVFRLKGYSATDTKAFGPSLARPIGCFGATTVLLYTLMICSCSLTNTLLMNRSGK